VILKYIFMIIKQYPSICFLKSRKANVLRAGRWIKLQFCVDYFRNGSSRRKRTVCLQFRRSLINRFYCVLVVDERNKYFDAT
jgi:hypothetical protein